MHNLHQRSDFTEAAQRSAVQRSAVQRSAAFKEKSSTCTSAGSAATSLSCVLYLHKQDLKSQIIDINTG